MTQPDLARVLGISVTTLQRGERDGRALGDELVARLARCLLDERAASLELGLSPMALRRACELARLPVWRSSDAGPLFWRPSLWRWAAETRTRATATLAEQAFDLAEALGFAPGEGVLVCDLCAEHEDLAPGVAFRECAVCRRNLCGSGDCGDEVAVPSEDPSNLVAVVCAACLPAVARRGGVRLGLHGSGVASAVADQHEAEYLGARAAGADFDDLRNRVAETHDYFERIRASSAAMLVTDCVPPAGVPDALATIRATAHAAERETSALARLLGRMDRGGRAT